MTEALIIAIILAAVGVVLCLVAYRLYVRSKINLGLSHVMDIGQDYVMKKHADEIHAIGGVALALAISDDFRSEYKAEMENVIRMGFARGAPVDKILRALLGTAEEQAIKNSQDEATRRALVDILSMAVKEVGSNNKEAV